MSGKLTEPRERFLAFLVKKGGTSEVIPRTTRIDTINSLIHFGLVSKVSPPKGYVSFTITDAGRAALQGDQK